MLRKIISVLTIIAMLTSTLAVPMSDSVYGSTAESTPVSISETTSEIKWTEGITGGAIYFDTATGTITRGDKDVRHVIIPSEIEGVRVTSIGVDAFRQCKKLTSVTISEGVTRIEEGAFSICYALTEVIIPSSVTYINDYAFFFSTDVTIKGIAGSYAEEFAKKNKYPFEELVKYFSGEKNGWPFPNNADGLGVGDSHRIPITTWFSMLGNEGAIGCTLQWLISLISWPGDCFGMSLGSALIYTSKFDASTLDLKEYNSLKSLNECGYQFKKTGDDGYQYYTIDKNDKALRFVEKLSLLQLSMSFDFKYKVFDKEENFDEFLQYLNDPKDDRVIMCAFEIKNLDGKGIDGGHAVIIDKSKPVIPNGENEYKVPLYDPNAPHDSAKLLNPADPEIYEVESYLVINTETNQYTYVTEKKDKGNNEEPLTFCDYVIYWGLTFYDVSDVSASFFDNVERIKECLENNVFIFGESWDILDEEKILVNFIDGYLSRPNNSDDVKMATRLIGDINSNANDNLYAVKLNSNNKNIIIDDGGYFVIGENSICGLVTKGKVESTLNLEGTQILVKGLQDDCEVNMILQDGLTATATAANIEVLLNKNEQIVIQNEDGVLNVNAPSGLDADIKVDTIEKSEEKKGVLLNQLDGHAIGKTTLDETFDKADDTDNHTCDWSIESAFKEASCTEAGTKKLTCSVCGDEKTVDIPIKEHSHTEKIVTPPTCTAEGRTTYKCSCGDTYTTGKVKALGHKFTKYVDDKAATCTTEGTTTAMCDNGCGKTDAKATAKLAHIPVTDAAIIPTCTVEGKTTGTHCSVCNTVLKAQEEISATGHHHTSVVTAPTCTSEGYTTYTCACGDSYTSDKIAAVGHQAKTITVKATTKNAGSVEEICTVCNVQLSKQDIAKIGKTKLASTSYAYNGFKRKPSVTVTDAEGKKLKKGTDYTVTYKNAKGTKTVTPKAVGKYKVVVNFKGNYSGTATKSFKINPRATKITKLTKNGKKQFTVKLKKIKKQAAGYEVMYSTSKTFKKGKLTKTKVIKKANTTSLKITTVKAKTKYYVKVRTYKTVKINGKSTKLYSKWSKVKTVRTK